MRRSRDVQFEATEIPDADAVERRLVELGLTVAELLEAIRQGQLAADFCTNAHPVSYPGVRAWGENQFLPPHDEVGPRLATSR